MHMRCLRPSDSEQAACLDSSCLNLLVTDQSQLIRFLGHAPLYLRRFPPGFPAWDPARDSVDMDEADFLQTLIE